MNLKVTMIAVPMVLSFACAEKATKEDCTSACQKYVSLKEAAKPVTENIDLVAKYTADFDTKIAELKTKQEQEVKAIDTELQTKLGEAKTDADKTNLNNEYAAKKTAKEQEYAPQLQTFEADKLNAIKQATEQKTKQMVDEKAKRDREANGCSDSCVQTSTTKQKTTCQMSAPSLSAYEQCK
ncbi:MAG: hypothetical protein V2A73_05980 [Pseudomonadota bacterium]